MAPADPLVLRVRDAVHAAAEGDATRWVPVQEITARLALPDDAVHAALRRAADEGWLITGGGRQIERVRLTEEGLRTCRRHP